MLKETDIAEGATIKINNKSNLQIMSHCVMALRQNIEDRLKKCGDANSVFEEKIKSLYGEKTSNFSYKAYVRLEWIDDFENSAFARIYSKIDKVLSVEDGSISYALHLGITSHRKGTSSYDGGGFVSEDSGRFAVGHDIGHAVLNLKDLIKNATTSDNESIIKKKKDDDAEKHYEADFFSYILSDLRDFHLLKLHGKYDLDKAFENYKIKAVPKFLGNVIKEILSEALITEDQFIDKIRDKIEERFNGIKEVFKKSKKLYDDSLQYTMSHPIVALNEIINSKFQSEADCELENLRVELKKLELNKESVPSIEGLSQPEIKKIFLKYKIDKEMEDLNKKIENLENKKPRINIHLISKECDSKEVFVDCYNRRDEDSKKDSYCFEIAIKKFSKEERNERCKEICKAILFIYFCYKSIIKRFENNDKGHLTIYDADVQQYVKDSGLDEKTINSFADKLCKLRKENFRNKCERIKKETNLEKRLAGCVST